MQVKTSLYCHYLNATVPAQDFIFSLVFFSFSIVVLFPTTLLPVFWKCFFSYIE
jgi:hypothetical protein